MPEPETVGVRPGEAEEEQEGEHTGSRHPVLSCWGPGPDCRYCSQHPPLRCRGRTVPRAAAAQPGYGAKSRLRQGSNCSIGSRRRSNSLGWSLHIMCLASTSSLAVLRIILFIAKIQSYFGKAAPSPLRITTTSPITL